MGFRQNSYAKVWEITPQTDTRTKLRISISRKDKATGEYFDDFNGFVECVGTATAKRAASLTAGDRIMLGDVDVTNKYDKEKKLTYTNFVVFNFKTAEEAAGQPAPEQSKPNPQNEPQPNVDDGEVDDNRLPF